MFSLLLSCVLIMFLFSGCLPSDASGNENNGKLRVVTTIFPPYDFVREIAGDLVELKMLLPPGAESHSYEPSPRDISAIQDCDFLLFTGGESDAWVKRILGSMDTNGIKLMPLISLVESVPEEIVEGMEHDEENEAGYDEHVWTSPRNAIIIVEAIGEALCQLDDKNANSYRQNTEDYLSKLAELDRGFTTAIRDAKHKTLVFGDRFPFRYLADTYGLEYYAAFPGCSSETEPSASTVAFLIDKVREESIPVVFHIELSNEKMADTICESTGAKKLLLHSCHNVTKKEMAEGCGYLQLMNKNLEHIREALVVAGK